MSQSPLLETAHRPYPLPQGPWRMRQSWNDLLFAHWPIAPQAMAPCIPEGLEMDCHDGWAWLGVVPFWMDQVTVRPVGSATFGVPTVRTFAELNLRTYVRSPRSGKRGVLFFSLDCESPLAVLGARLLYHLPYFPAAMRRTTEGDTTRYSSRRQMGRKTPRFAADYEPTGEVALSRPGSLDAFLTERYCLFTPHRGRILCGDIHHLQWPLQPAGARFEVDEVPAAHGFTLPHRPPVLHFSRRLEVYIWPLKADVREGV